MNVQSQIRPSPPACFYTPLERDTPREVMLPLRWLSGLAGQVGRTNTSLRGGWKGMRGFPAEGIRYTAYCICPPGRQSFNCSPSIFPSHSAGDDCKLSTITLHAWSWRSRVIAQSSEFLLLCCLCSQVSTLKMRAKRCCSGLQWGTPVSGTSLGCERQHEGHGML